MAFIEKSYPKIYRQNIKYNHPARNAISKMNRRMSHLLYESSSSVGSSRFSMPMAGRLLGLKTKSLFPGWGDGFITLRYPIALLPPLSIPTSVDV